MARLTKLLALGGALAGAAAVVRRRRSSTDASPAPPPDPAPSAAAAAAAAPPSVATASPPPVETPGPSVTPPASAPESDVERAEAAEARTPAPSASDDALVAEEEAAAAAEARRIGGPALDDAEGDPAMEPVYEAGGGEAEGFELAERELIRNASHDDGRAEPTSDAFTPERESDLSTARYGEPDEEDVTEVVRDPGEDGEDDPGEGPGLAAER